MLDKLFQTDANWALTIVRIVLGLVIFAHGVQKMLGWLGGYGFSGFVVTHPDVRSGAGVYYP